jgi:hypothetical protein
MILAIGTHSQITWQSYWRIALIWYFSVQVRRAELYYGTKASGGEEALCEFDFMKIMSRRGREEPCEQ